MRSIRIRLFIVSLLFMSLACKMPRSLVPKILYSTPPGLYSTTSVPGLELATATSENSGSYDPHGELRFLTDEAIVSTTGEGWFKPVFGCWPSSYYDDGGGYLRLTAGILEGYCSWTPPSQINPKVTWNTGGTLTGDHNLMTGEFNFTFKTSAHYSNFMNVSITYYGSGTFTTKNHAEGSASFTATCTSIGEELNCTHTTGEEIIRRKSWEISGTVPWTIDFTP